MNPLTCLIVNAVVFVAVTLGSLPFDHTGSTSAVLAFLWMIPAAISFFVATD